MSNSGFIPRTAFTTEAQRARRRQNASFFSLRLCGEPNRGGLGHSADLELGITRRGERERLSFQVRIKKCVNAVRGHDDLAAAVDSQHSKEAKNSAQKPTLAKRAVVAECEMV